MSISAVNGATRAYQQTEPTQSVTPAPAQTPFSQQLDIQSAQTGATHGHHHHHAPASQSVTSSSASATAAAAAGGTSSSTVGSSVLNLLS